MVPGTSVIFSALFPSGPRALLFISVVLTHAAQRSGLYLLSCEFPALLIFGIILLYTHRRVSLLYIVEVINLTAGIIRKRDRFLDGYLLSSVISWDGDYTLFLAWVHTL